MAQSNVARPQLMKMNANSTPKLDKKISRTPETDKLRDLASKLFSIVKRTKVYSIKRFYLSPYL